MACFNVPHLVRRGGVYGFRMAVPRDLVAQFGRRKLSSAFEQLILQVRGMAGLTPEVITALIQDYFRQCLAKSDEIADFAPEDLATHGPWTRTVST